jgi:hypothetical protein
VSRQTLEMTRDLGCPAPAGGGPPELSALAAAVLAHPRTGCQDSVLCLLEAVGVLWPALRPGMQPCADDVAAVRSCLRAASLSLRSHLWSTAGEMAGAPSRDGGTE